MQQRMVVLGCGDFGAQVVAHLEARGAVGPRLLTCLGPASIREAGAVILRQRWESLGLATADAEPSLHLVAAADDPAGGGMVVAALSAWGGRSPCHLWLALPPAQADKAACARTFATLAELETLRASGHRIHGWLDEQGDAPFELAHRFGDALLYRAQRGGSLGSPAFRGFGLGVVKDPLAPLRRRLTHRIAVMVVEDYLRRPDPAHLLAGMTESLQRPMRPLFRPVSESPVYGQRWSQAGLEGGGAAALLDYYEPHGAWYRRAQEFWDGALSEAKQGLASAMGRAWRSGFEVIYAEARASLAQAHGLLESEMERCERAVGEHQNRFEAALIAVEQGQGALSELDSLVAIYLLESMRLGALDRFALAMDGVLELVMDALWAKANRVRSLLEAVQERRPAAAGPRLGHGLTMNPSAEQEAEWLQEVQPRLARAYLYEHDPAEVEALVEEAQRDVERYIRTRNPDLHLPRGHRIRTAWLASTAPKVGVVLPKAVRYEFTTALPATYQEDLLTQAAQVHEQPVEWFPDEAVVYAETSPFALAELSGLARWAEAYQAAPPQMRQGLHVLPETAAGWLFPPLTDPQSQAAAADMGTDSLPLLQARTAVRLVLLGLITPDSSGHLMLRQAVSDWRAGRSVGTMTDLLAALGTDDALGRALEAAATQRLEALSLSLRVGYCALLRWFQTAALDGDRGAVGQQTLLWLHKAAEVERVESLELLRQAGEDWARQGVSFVPQLGTPADQVTVVAGPWRCLRTEAGE